MDNFSYVTQHVSNKKNNMSDDMSRMCTARDEISYHADGMLSEQLRTPSSSLISSFTGHLDNFSGKHADSFTCDFLLSYGVISSQQKLDENLQRKLCDKSASTIV